MRYEIWATFENGLNVMVESHGTEQRAKTAIAAMNHANECDIAEGYGFPCGVPSYTIRKA